MENKTIISTKTLFVIVSVIVIAVLGLILFVQYKGGFGIPVATPPEISVPEATLPLLPKEEVVLTEEEVREIRRRATETLDISLCQKLRGEGDKEYCRYVVINAEAGIKQDPDICNQLEDEHKIIVCKDNVIVTEAMSSKDLTLCEKLTDKTRIEQCKEDVAALK